MEDVVQSMQDVMMTGTSMEGRMIVNRFRIMTKLIIDASLSRAASFTRSVHVQQNERYVVSMFEHWMEATTSIV